MFLRQTKKEFEQQDEKEFEEKEKKYIERQQRETVVQRAPADRSRPEVGAGANRDAAFRPEELPDGACFRPKSVLSGTESDQTAVRPAEYIGSFSVTGNDQDSRVEFVQKQLESMQNVTKSKTVLLSISLSGVKVCCSSGESVYMAHALKRISYATCDPDHCQFSFLAREPKGHINVQYCHAFSTKTSQEAEELNTIIGNAFKMAYAQQLEKPKVPTFNELIEQQLIKQKADYQEYQVQVQKAFQEKLNEIATPTPFSEKAQQRMEMRRQISDEPPPEREFAVGKNKVWAKHAVEKVRHRSPAVDPSQESVRSESPPAGKLPNSPRHSVQGYEAAFKRNSTPPNVPSSQVRSVFDNTNNSSKFKGSPVTALKEAIDRGYICNGSDSLTSTPNNKDEYLQPKLSKGSDEKSRYNAKMINRPLPALPSDSNGNRDIAGSPRKRIWSSVDDEVLIHHSRSQVTHLAYDSKNIRRETPRRRPQRPVSDVFDSKVSSNFYGARAAGLDEPGMYMYSSKSQLQIQQHISASNSRVDASAHQLMCEQRAGPSGHSERPDKQRALDGRSPQHVGHSSQHVGHSPQHVGHSPQHTGHSPQHVGHSPQHVAALRYQNDSPFQDQGGYESPVDPTQSSSKSRPGLESLMGLDRSHIEDETLRHASWYQAGIPREVALEILQQEDIGSFIVRDSTTHPGCYALSVRVPKFENPTGISHYLILKTQKGVKLKGLDREWSNLIALVTHHTVMPEMLPCTLRLPRNTNNPTFKDSDKDDKEEDPDYQRLSDFSTMMATLKM